MLYTLLYINTSYTLLTHMCLYVYIPNRPLSPQREGCLNNVCGFHAVPG